MGGGRRRYVQAVALAALIGLAAGCGSSSSSSSPGSGTSSSTTTPGSAGSTATATISAAAQPFAAIVEPFDPGHPAQVQQHPGQLRRPVDDARHRAVLRGQDREHRRRRSTPCSRPRTPAGQPPSRRPSWPRTAPGWPRAGRCAGRPSTPAAPSTGSASRRCLLDESTARLNAVKGITPPEAKLKATDSIDPNQLSWYTTPEGSRIAEISTQGDQTGGAIVAWVIIGGADGFVINPKQFYYSDGSFTDYGHHRGP